LDGWRFIAFLSVFFYHAFHTEYEYIKVDPTYKLIKGLFKNGGLGVDFFFVLSGFLIIYLLISEKEATGKIDAKKFYIRRILRIFPLYYLCVFFGFGVFPQLKALASVVPDETANLPYYLVFLGNIDIVKNQALPDSGVLAILWSVSVEEQFYLTIPFILMAAPIRFFKWVFASVIVLSWVFRAYNIDDHMMLTFHTFSFAGNLAMGGLIAFYSCTSQRFVSFFEELDHKVIKLVYCCVIAIFFFRDEIFSMFWLNIFSTSVIAALFAFIILEQNCSKHSFFKMKNNWPFTKLGKYTYGLYCLHIIAALVVLQITQLLGINTLLWQVVAIEMPLMLLVTVIMAYFSYQYFERPFLLLKDRYSVLGKRPLRET
jgi:peptidoglycan/LPS O-acetylase OafA/YrhL